ncbi:MAG: Rab family GTPase [Candidatus Thorarchaeota archaeon]
MEERPLIREPRRRQFKICLIGDGFVGKTSIRLKYLKGGFKRNYIPTLGVDFAQKLIQHEGIPTNLVIWDIAGQALFQNLRKRYYDGASGVILVYSVIDKVAFANARKWLEEAAGFMEKLPPLIIIGNKIDLRESNPPEEIVTTQRGRDFAENISKILNTRAVFIETSALTGENIDRAFEALVELMVEEMKKRDPSYVPQDTTPTPQAAPSTLIDLSKTEESEAESATEEPETQEPVSEEPAVTAAADSSPMDATVNEDQDTDARTYESVVDEITRAYEAAVNDEPAVEETTVVAEESSQVAEESSEVAEESSEREIVSTAKSIAIDPVTTLPQDSEYLHEEQIGSAMGDLVRLREELRVAEEELAKTMSELDTTLLNLKNVIHVKKIMYTHLQEQLKTTRQEWADAYDQYLLSEQRRSSEMAQRSKHIEELRKEIDNVGKKIRTRVGDLDLKKITE